MSPSSTQAAAYQFRPVAGYDLAMVRGWQMAPHVQEWWDDDPIALAAAADEPGKDQLIVAVDGQPFAYLQCYLQSACPENGLGEHPAGTRGIDQFIGVADPVGRGHGSLFIRVFCDGLLAAGVPRVITDPQYSQCARDPGLHQRRFPRRCEVDTPDGSEL